MQKKKKMLKSHNETKIFLGNLQKACAVMDPSKLLEKLM